jgi:prolyl-tRNA synthetase
MTNNSIVVVRRDNGVKESVSLDNLIQRSKEIVQEMHTSMLEKAKNTRNDSIAQITKWEEFIPALDKRKIVLAPWCGRLVCEDDIKGKSADKKSVDEKKEEDEFEALTGAAKSLCIPLEQPTQAPGKCFCCDQEAKTWVLWGRSY